MLDKGYDNETGFGVCVDHEYVPHIALIRDERPTRRGRKYKPRRWVVERVHSWLNACRGILVRWERRGDLYAASIKVASILLWYRRLESLSFLR